MDGLHTLIHGFDNPGCMDDLISYTINVLGLTDGLSGHAENAALLTVLSPFYDINGFVM